MSKHDHFERMCRTINALEAQGHCLNSDVLVEAYQRRNLFGLAPETRLHRIFQRDFLDADIAGSRLTLPRASAVLWNDSLENPLANVSGRDAVTGGEIDVGNLVRSLHALCWTQRAKAIASDWTSFAHGRRASRITTTANKLMSRVVNRADPSYMHRVWLIEVDYATSSSIRAMQAPASVVRRMESTGASLALTAATVRSQYVDEDEVRLLYDAGLRPLPVGVTEDVAGGLVRIPFDWTDVIEEREERR